MTTMAGQGALVLCRFPEPSAMCDAETYAGIVEKTIAESCTLDEVADLMAYFQCRIEKVVQQITAYKLGKSTLRATGRKR